MYKITRLKESLMKKIFVAGFCSLICCGLYAQKAFYSLYAGANLSGMQLDLSSHAIKDIRKKALGDPGRGFQAGYSCIIPAAPRLHCSIGILYSYLKVGYYRPYYNVPGTPNPNLYSVSEQLKFSRVSVPAGANYLLMDNEKSNIYITGGASILFTNSAKRTVSYKIPSPPSGYTDVSYTSGYSFAYGNNKNFGLGFHTGIGTEFAIRKRRFSIELQYYTDISQTRIPTLHGIEADAEYSGKLKSFVFKFGYSFLSKNKDYRPWYLGRKK